MSAEASNPDLPQPLPEDVRRVVLALAASVVGTMPVGEVPAGLVRVRSFAPAKRAASGSGPLAAALEQAPGFRSHVAGAWREAHPELAESLRAGSVPPAADPADVLAGLFLIRPEGWIDLDRTARSALRSDVNSGRDEAIKAANDVRLEAMAARVQEAQAAQAGAAAQASDLVEELAAARKELRKARAEADRARAAARESTVRADDAEARAREAERTRASEAGAHTVALRDLQQELEVMRQSGREGKALGESRIRLLLDTVVDAATGLRRELALRPDTATPADLLGNRLGAHGGDDAVQPPVRAHAAEDPARLAELLALPRVHLIVDGYNVTKSAYPSMVLADQRRRLVEGLMALAARTGAEVTCCFDGAVTEGRSAGRVRGVRVLFSDPGVTADEVIRRLARAEPQGRVVIVASSDGEVIRGVTAVGAHPVGAMALARLLTRGTSPA